MLFQMTLAQMVHDAIVAANTLAGANVNFPGVWPTQKQNFPAVIIDVPHDHKDSLLRGQPSFNTTSYIGIEAQIWSTTLLDCKNKTYQLWDQITQAVIGDNAIIKVTQQFPTIDTKAEWNSGTEFFIGHITMMVAMEFYEGPETYDTTAQATGVNVLGVHVDAANIFDATGTYPATPWPDAVAAAPRTTGPDGRDEVYAQAIVNQTGIDRMTEDLAERVTEDGQVRGTAP
jgi:hypothetical protein